MSEEKVENTETNTEAAAPKDAGNNLRLNTLFAFKEGMSSYIDEKGDMIPVTVFRFEPWIVSQLKTEEKDGYKAVQLACRPKKASRMDEASKGHFKTAGFENGAAFAREVRKALPDTMSVGQKLDLQSLAAGDVVGVTGISKGKGFQGAVRRWNVAGGPATHGSGFQRTPGSVGNRTWPGRVMPGKKFPGHLGSAQITVKSQVIEVLTDESVLILKGSIPGARHALVQITKV